MSYFGGVSLIFGVVLLTITADHGLGLTCYEAPSSKGSLLFNTTLPDDAANKTFSFKNGACFKSRTVTTSYSTTGGVQTKISEMITYAWSATDLQALGDTITCQNRSDISMTQATSDPNLVSTLFIRMCFCCGDSCNGDAMDSQCNDLPKFTKTCYGGHGTSPEFRNAVAKLDVPATDTMSCYKSSSVGDSQYMWGASNLGAIDKCGGQSQSTGGKICTCCGKKCNNESMDSDCLLDASKPLAAPITTTSAPDVKAPAATTAKIAAKNAGIRSLIVSPLFAYSLIVAVIGAEVF